MENSMVKYFGRKHVKRWQLPQVQNDEETKECKNRKIKRKILKNVVILSVAFFLLFTSFNAISFLQSSINQDKNVGTNSLSVVYAAMVVSLFFTPSWMIEKFKEKKTIAVSMGGYLIYIAAQFYPCEYTLYPAAVIVGVSAAPMWSAKFTYTAHIAKRYAEIVEEDPEVITSRFFGIFFFFLQSTYTWGNLISSTILSMEPTVVLSNDTNRLSKCGVNYCKGKTDYSVTLSKEVSLEQRYIMASAYLVCAAIAPIMIFLFLDPMSKIQEDANLEKVDKKSGKELLVSTFRHMCKPYQLLLIPWTVLTGMEQAFISADFTAAYVGCGMGVHITGYVLIGYGICDSIISLICGPLVKLIGRVSVFSGAALIQATSIAVLLFWKPNPDQFFVFFVISGMWGVSDAIWITQISSYYSVLFPTTREAAFSNYGLWQALGYILTFACTAQLCTDYKIYMMIACLTLSMSGFYIIEFNERKKIFSH